MAENPNEISKITKSEKAVWENVSMTTITSAPMKTATVTFAEPQENGQTVQHFVSLNGESYLPVTRPPMPGEHESVEALFAGTDGFKPMTCAPRWINYTAQEGNGTVEWGEVA